MNPIDIKFNIKLKIENVWFVMMQIVAMFVVHIQIIKIKTFKNYLIKIKI